VCSALPEAFCFPLTRKGTAEFRRALYELPCYFNASKWFFKV
jgi:hypothetical protein